MVRVRVIVVKGAVCSGEGAGLLWLKVKGTVCSGEVAELRPAEYPSLYKPMRVPKCHKNAKTQFWFVRCGLL